MTGTKELLRQATRLYLRTGIGRIERLGTRPQNLLCVGALGQPFSFSCCTVVTVSSLDMTATGTAVMMFGRLLA